MKNVSWPEGSIFRKKGFFVALYSCLGLVAILAVVITVANRSPTYDYPDELAVYVGADQVPGYMDQFANDAWFRPRETPPPQPEPEPEPLPPPEPEPIPEPEPEPEPAPTPAPAPPPPAPPPAAVEPEPEPAAEAETFTPFTAEDRLAWPVYGEVLMPFSITALVFDPTMDRFSTNDNLRIAANEGDPVRAGADGQVVAIGTDFWRGNYVTIDHGNGWQSTIGQLMESVMVHEGDIVRAGQIIGGVGTPSITASTLGPHTHLYVTYQDQPIDPADLLQSIHD